MGVDSGGWGPGGLGGGGCHGQGTSFCFCFLCSFVPSRLVFHDRTIKKGFV